MTGYFYSHNDTLIANISTTCPDSDVFLSGIIKQRNLAKGAAKWNIHFSQLKQAL